VLGLETAGGFHAGQIEEIYIGFENSVEAKLKALSTDTPSFDEL
jgi:hypothetical protein